MIKLTTLLFALILLTQNVIGKEIPGLVAAQPAVVQIVVDNGNGGSGAYIKDGLILTCRHLFSRKNNDAKIIFNNGETIRAKFIKSDKIWDLAVMRLVKLPKKIKPIRLARKIPKVGDYLHSVGFGSRGKIRWATGKLKSFSTTNRNTKTNDNFKINNGGSRKGDSGGPIFNNTGELVGVLWGATRNSTDGTQVGRCLTFLEGTLSPNQAYNG